MTADFWDIYLVGLGSVLILFTALWMVSVPLKNASVVDIFWGLGFVTACVVYWWIAGGQGRGLLVLVLTIIWGTRLSLHIAIRNRGKGEDYRYVEFRKRYGEKNYWWFSFFQVFLLQAILLWLISAPLAAAQLNPHKAPYWLDGLALTLWVIGFAFEATGDYQLRKFKSDPANKGKVLRGGLWKYTRHPNYFGDAVVWWSFALFSVVAGTAWPLLSAALMTFLLLKVSGVTLLEKNLSRTKPEYADYIDQTPAFFPWFPESNKS